MTGMSSEAATANTYSSAFAQLPLYRELSPDAGKSSHVNRKREWHQKFQEDLMRRGSPDEPDDAEAEAVEALKGAKVPRVAGSFMNDSGRFTKGSRVAEAREVLRPAAVHAHRPLELGGNGAFISPVSARGVLQTSASSIARPDGAYKAGNMDELLAHLQHAGGAAVPEDDKVSENADFEISQENIGAKKARHARRGPMDEMRQLVRILVKIVPQSLPHLATTEDGGGNRISEEQIKYYLDKTLGHAPRPDWGLPRGWGQYLAVLFEWATCRPFTEDEARMCAKRLPGRSWEAVESVLEQFCLRPHTWKLPLQRGSENVDGLWLLTDDSRASQRVAPEEESVKQPKKQRVCLPNLNKADSLPEAELWKAVLHLVKVAASKHGTTPDHLRDSLHTTKKEVREAVEATLAVSSAPSATPSLPTTASASTPPTFFPPSLSGLQSVDLQSLQQAISSQGLQLSQLLHPQQQQSIPVSGINFAGSNGRLGNMLAGNGQANHSSQSTLGGLTALQGSAAANLILNRQIMLPSGQGAFQQVQQQQHVQNIPIQSYLQPRESEGNAGGAGAPAGKPADTITDRAHKSSDSVVEADEQHQRGERQWKESPPKGAPSSTPQSQGQFGVSLLTANNSSSQKSQFTTDLSSISTGGLMPLLNYSCYGGSHNPTMDLEQQKIQQLSAQQQGGVDGSQQQQQQQQQLQQQQNNLTLAGLYANQYNRGGISALQLSGGQLVYADLGNQFQQVQGLGQLQGLSQLQSQNPMSSMLGAQPVLLALHQPNLGFAQPQMIGGGMMGGVVPGQQGVQQIMSIGNNSG